MQDPSSLYTQMNAQVHQQQQQQQQHPQAQAQFPEQEHLKCPRCDSANTKFCYYNNYNLSQPRHFCKSCRRYWTKGGSLRNIPVGGGSRKNAKRSSSSATAADVSPSSASAPKRPASAPPPPPDKSKGDDEGGEVSDKMPVKGDNFEGQFGDFLGAASGSSFSSLLGSTEGQYSNFMDGPSGLPDQFGDTGSGQNMDPSGGGSSNNNNGDGFLNGWPDLSMYTPGSSFL